MTDEELHNHLKEVNDRIYEQLSYAETKHAVLIGFTGAAVFALIGIIIDISEYDLLWLQIVLGVMSFSMLISLVFSLSSFIPNRSKMRPSNLYFYGDIEKLPNAENYISNINNDNDLNFQLAEQNITVSKIISKKHDKFKIALNLCVASIVLPYYIMLLIKSLLFLINNKKCKRKLTKK